ncbi:MAG: SEC-C metal-binding domain-containing protein [Lachnospiraceae bacterium]|nr:SEC-C metal-binding domain-containing protein [Lachnospiraceae bacterium]
MDTQERNIQTQPLSPMDKANGKYIEFWEAQAREMNDPQAREVYVPIRLTGKQVAAEKLFGQYSAAQVQFLRHDLCIDTGKATKAVGIADILKMLKSHPAYLLYVMDSNNLQALQDLYRHEPGPLLARLRMDPILFGMRLGLLECKVLRGKICEVSFSELADLLFEYATPDRSMKIYRMLRSTWVQMYPYLQIYGIIDVDSFYEIFSRSPKNTLGRDEFDRILNLHIRECNLIVMRRHRANGQMQIIFNDRNLVENMLTRDMEMPDLPYREIDLQEIENINRGINTAYYSIDSLLRHLQHRCGLEEPSLSEELTNIVYLVQSGADLPTIVQALEAYKEPRDISDYATEWNLAAWLAMELPQTGLKGHSRADLKQMGLELPPSEKLQRTREEAAITKDTHLYELPDSVQEILARNTVSGPEVSLQLCQQAFEMTGSVNEEVLYLLADAHMSLGHFGEARRHAIKLKKSVSAENRSAVEELIRNIDNLQDCDDDFDVNAGVFGELPSPGGLGFQASDSAFPFDFSMPAASQPVRREAKKVGRNEPCPCGSGRKYKHCCGR